MLHNAKIWGLFGLAGLSSLSLAQDLETAGSFTEAQVAAGLAAYQTNCANACHQNDMTGNGPVAALRGTPFTSVWNNRPVSELITAMRTQMPPTNVGGLPLQTMWIWQPLFFLPMVARWETFP